MFVKDESECITPESVAEEYNIPVEQAEHIIESLVEEGVLMYDLKQDAYVLTSLFSGMKYIMKSKLGFGGSS